LKPRKRTRWFRRNVTVAVVVSSLAMAVEVSRLDRRRATRERAATSDERTTRDSVVAAKQPMDTALATFLFGPDGPISTADLGAASSSGSDAVHRDVVAAMCTLAGSAAAPCSAEPLQTQIAACKALWLHASKKTATTKAAAQTAAAPNPLLDAAAAAVVTAPGGGGGTAETLPLPTAALFAAVTLSAFIDFRDMTVSEMLHLTASAATAATATATATATAARAAPMCALRDIELCVLLARVKALARIAQYDFAVAELLRLLPTYFERCAARNTSTTNAISPQPSPGIALKGDTLARRLAAVPALRERVLRAASSALLRLGAFEAVHQLCADAAISGGGDGDVPGWAASATVWAQLGALVDRERAALAAGGRCLAPRARLLRHLTFTPDPPAALTPLAKQVQRALAIAANAVDAPALAAAWAADLRLLLGVLLYLAGGRLRTDPAAGCSAHLLEEVKLFPGTGRGYTYLGHYYASLAYPDAEAGVAADAAAAERAVKCYLKAVGIDPCDEEAGGCLSELLVLRGEEARAVRLWADVTALRHGHESHRHHHHCPLPPCAHPDPPVPFVPSLSLSLPPPLSHLARPFRSFPLPAARTRTGRRSSPRSTRSSPGAPTKPPEACNGACTHPPHRSIIPLLPQSPTTWSPPLPRPAHSLRPHHTTHGWYRVSVSVAGAWTCGRTTRSAATSSDTATPRCRSRALLIQAFGLCEAPEPYLRRPLSPSV